MAQVPTKQGRRWEDYKFIYTNDDGTDIVTSQRITKNDTNAVNPRPFLSPTTLLEGRKVTDPAVKKAKFWGKPSNLRKLEITYGEPRNNTGIGELTRYIPFRPTDPLLLSYILEVRDALRAKFEPYKVVWCANYRGENRFTVAKPQIPDDNNQSI